MLLLLACKAETRYFYRIGNSSSMFTVVDVNIYFTTFPLQNVSIPDILGIWAIGDFGKANYCQKRVRNAFENYDWERKTDVWLWLGDNAYIQRRNGC